MLRSNSAAGRRQVPVVEHGDHGLRHVSVGRGGIECERAIGRLARLGEHVVGPGAGKGRAHGQAVASPAHAWE